jgi:chemotaxis protein MotB
MKNIRIANRSILFILIFITGAAISCVPARKYEELVERRQQCEDQNQELRNENAEFYTQNNELTSERDRLRKDIEKLRRDTTDIGIEFRRLETNYDRLYKTYEIILEQNAKLMDGKEVETRQILARLQETQDDLQRREDELRKASAQMEAKERSLNELNERLQQSALDIKSKEVRLNELEQVLARQDSVVQALRRTVSNALLGFEGQGLTIEMKNGKVYVSLDESLLFATGSTTVDAKGVSALRELAKVLERNPDISVLIEGHTDDVPLRSGSQIRDNWDLSVLRATAIVRILTSNSTVDPRRLTAAGRGEFFPVDPAKTPEARRKNRRTEIILTPRLDDLFQIIDTN